MGTPCLHCGNLRGCHLLEDQYGNFVIERVIKEDNPYECERWTEVTPRQKAVRDGMYEICGLGTIRAVHIMPPNDQSTKALEELEAEETRMKEDTPDFAAMLWEGMTTTDRRQQLEYETDDNGDFIIEEDNEGNPRMRPRPSYQLHNFACDPEKHIGLDLRTGAFWPTNKVIDFILRSEVEQELITKDKKAKTANDEETEDMGKRVILNRGKKPGTEPVAGKPAGGGPKKSVVPSKVGGGARGAPGGTVARPPQKGGIKKPMGPKPGGPRPAGPKPAEAPSPAEVTTSAVDVGAIVEQVTRSLAPILEEKTNEVTAAVAELRANFNDLIAILHDRLCQTKGTMAYQAEDDEGNPLFIDEAGDAAYEGEEPYEVTFEPVYHVEGQLMSASPDFEGGAAEEAPEEGAEVEYEGEA